MSILQISPSFVILVCYALVSFVTVTVTKADDGTGNTGTGIPDNRNVAPNIVFILADDLGWDDVGFHGSEIKTPNIDKLAKEGVILNNYYVQPICTPTRSAILTGKYPIHTGMQHYVIVGSQPYGLPLQERTMAQYLKAMGYSTHAVGKWHLGFFKEDYLPTSRGFDSHYGYYLGKEDYFDHYTYDGKFFGYDFHHNGSTVWNEDEVYSTELFTAQAQSIIKGHDTASPLFMYLAHQAVHAGDSWDPIQAPQKYVDRFPYIKDYNRRLFAGAVSALDDSVGAVYSALQDAGMAENTIIIFSTDNGGPTNGFDRNAACNWPLRGCKRTLWQGGVRGVGFVHSPLLKKSGYVNNNLMHVSDWLPTVLAMANTSTSTTTTTTTTTTSNLAASASRSEVTTVNDNLQQSRPHQHNQHHRQQLQREELKSSSSFTQQSEGGGGKERLRDFDGVNQWETISTNTSTARKEVLLNIDPIEKIEGVVVGDFKLVKGQTIHGRFDGWYPPPNGTSSDKAVTHDGDDPPNTDLDFEEIFKDYMKSFADDEFNVEKVSPLSKRMTEGELDSLIAELNGQFRNYLTQQYKKQNHQQRHSSAPELLFHSEKHNLSKSESSISDAKSRVLGQESINNNNNNNNNNKNTTDIIVKCGPKPANASTNCQPQHKACLFHLTSDPCEYNNLASALPAIVIKLQGRLNYYRSSMVPPANKPIDPNGNPQLHGGVWKPWM